MSECKGWVESNVRMDKDNIIIIMCMIIEDIIFFKTRLKDRLIVINSTIHLSKFIQSYFFCKCIDQLNTKNNTEKFLVNYRWKVILLRNCSI
jgi:hypothetical protein